MLSGWRSAAWKSTRAAAARPARSDCPAPPEEGLDIEAVHARLALPHVEVVRAKQLEGLVLPADLDEQPRQARDRAVLLAHGLGVRREVLARRASAATRAFS